MRVFEGVFSDRHQPERHSSRRTFIESLFLLFDQLDHDRDNLWIISDRLPVLLASSAIAVPVVSEVRDRVHHFLRLILFTHLDFEPPNY